MQTKPLFVKQLSIQRKREFFFRASKVLLILIIIVLAAFMIIDKVNVGDYATAVFLIISVVFYCTIAYLLFRSAMEFYSIHNSRIYFCIEKPEYVTEIIVTPQKILFEIKGMEDEALFIKNSKRKDEILESIKNTFGDDKIVMNN